MAWPHDIIQNSFPSRRCAQTTVQCSTIQGRIQVGRSGPSSAAGLHTFPPLPLGGWCWRLLNPLYSLPWRYLLRAYGPRKKSHSPYSPQSCPHRFRQHRLLLLGVKMWRRGRVFITVDSCAALRAQLNFFFLVSFSFPRFACISITIRPVVNGKALKYMSRICTLHNRNAREEKKITFSPASSSPVPSLPSL